MQTASLASNWPTSKRDIWNSFDAFHLFPCFEAVRVWALVFWGWNQRLFARAARMFHRVHHWNVVISKLCAHFFRPFDLPSTRFGVRLVISASCQGSSEVLKTAQRFGIFWVGENWGPKWCASSPSWRWLLRMYKWEARIFLQGG